MTIQHYVTFKVLHSTSSASRPSQEPNNSLVLCVTDSLLAARWGWPKTETDRISREHQHILFHNIHIFPFNHVTASAYFQRCALCRKSLTDGSVKGQYATFPMGISPNVKIMTRRAFELACHDIIVQYDRHYAKITPK